MPLLFVFVYCSILYFWILSLYWQVIANPSFASSANLISIPSTLSSILFIKNIKQYWAQVRVLWNPNSRCSPSKCAIYNYHLTTIIEPIVDPSNHKPIFVHFVGKDPMKNFVKSLAKVKIYYTQNIALINQYKERQLSLARLLLINANIMLPGPGSVSSLFWK